MTSQSKRIRIGIGIGVFLLGTLAIIGFGLLAVSLHT